MSEVKKYKSKFNFNLKEAMEDDVDKGTSKVDDKITDILTTLRDENFSNEAQRKKFIDLIGSLFNSNDKRARQTFKRLGQMFTNMADDLIEYGNE